MGSSPATGPTQNLGAEAQGVQAAAVIVDMLAHALPRVGASTPLGQALAKAMLDIGKHVPPGAGSPQAKQTQLQSLMMKQRQMAPQMAALQSQGMNAAPPPPSPPGAPPVGAQAA